MCVLFSLLLSRLHEEKPAVVLHIQLCTGAGQCWTDTAALHGPQTSLRVKRQYAGVEGRRGEAGGGGEAVLDGNLRGS